MGTAILSRPGHSKTLLTFTFGKNRFSDKTVISIRLTGVNGAPYAVELTFWSGKTANRLTVQFQTLLNGVKKTRRNLPSQPGHRRDWRAAQGGEGSWLSLWLVTRTGGNHSVGNRPPLLRPLCCDMRAIPNTHALGRASRCQFCFSAEVLA